MTRMMVAALAFVFSTTQVSAQQTSSLHREDLETLRDRMTGEFSSEKQSKADTSFFSISLKMTPVWKNEKDGYWFYVEQAMASALSKPYRQRIYHIYLQDEHTIVSKVYEMPDPKKYIGAADNPSLLQGLTRDSLIDRKGCSIYLQKDQKGHFIGSTPGKECLSSLRGATYATSEVQIDADGLSTWDRGWNASDKQVWGSVKGPYRFDRVRKD